MPRSRDHASPYPTATDPFLSMAAVASATEPEGEPEGVVPGEVPPQAIEIDPRADGKKDALEPGDAVVLTIDPTKQLGRVFASTLHPNRSGEVIYHVVFPDRSSASGYASLYRTRAQLFYCGFGAGDSLGEVGSAPPIPSTRKPTWESHA